MDVLIDSSILIESERGHLDLTSRLAHRGEEVFYLSVISVSELLHGVHRAVDAHVKARRSAFVEAILDRFPILPVDSITVRMHAQLWASLEAQGIMIGLHDSWLAAACLAHSLAISTCNAREFQRVSGLTVELWSEQG